VKVNRIHNIVGNLFRRSRTKPTRAQKWIIALGVLILVLGLANLARAALALRYNALLPSMPMTVSLTYVAATSGFWGLVSVVCAVGLVRFYPWGRWGTLAVATLYEIHVWVNHLLFDASDYARQTWPRDLALTLLLLILTWALLNWPSIRKEFKR
jgi:hypothetical protein